MIRTIESLQRQAAERTPTTQPRDMVPLTTFIRGNYLNPELTGCLQTMVGDQKKTMEKAQLLSTGLSIAKDGLTDLRHKEEEIKRQLSREKGQVATLTSRLTESEEAAQRATRLQGELSAATARAAEAAAATERAEAELRAKQSELDASAASVATIRNELAQQLQDAYTAAETEKTELEQQLEQVRARVDDIDAQRRSVLQQKEAAEEGMTAAQENERRAVTDYETLKRTSLCCGTGVDGIPLSCCQPVGQLADVTVRAINQVRTLTAMISLQCDTEGCRSAQCTDCICVQADRFGKADTDTPPICYRCEAPLSEAVVRAAMANRDKTEAATSAPMQYERRVAALKAQQEVETIRRRHAEEVARLTAQTGETGETGEGGAAGAAGGMDAEQLGRLREVHAVLSTGMVAPCCGSVIANWSQCCNVTCSNAECRGAHFCGWCDKVYRGNRAHDDCGNHVGQCAHNPTPGNVFVRSHRAALMLHTARKAIQFDRLCKADNMPIMDGPKRYKMESAEMEGRRICEGAWDNFQDWRGPWSFEHPTVEGDM